MVNVGIIGCGKVATAHINALLKIPEAKISAVCDVDEERCRKFAEKTCANAYTSYEEMTDKENLGLVIICLPPAFHGACVRYCAEKKINVFVEKPMGIDVSDCRSMIEICEQNGVMLWVGHMQCYSEENVIAKELIASGKYGDLISINEVRTCRYPGPVSPKWLMNKAVSGGGILYNFGAHTLDMVKYITGSKVVSVQCGVSLHEEGTENAASGMLKLENGVSVTFNLMGNCDVNRYEITLYLSKGEIRIIPRQSISVCGANGVFETISEASEEATGKSWQYLQLCDVIKATENKEAKVGGAYGLGIIQDLEMLYKSAGIM